MEITYFGSGICSHRRRTIGAILIVARPATMMQSACRGVARGMMPIRSMSKRVAYACIISMAQQASPKVSGHTEAARPQFRTSSTLVRITPPPGSASMTSSTLSSGNTWLRGTYWGSVGTRHASS